VRAVASLVAALFLAFAVAEPAVAASRYTVVPHDTLSSIARRFHVPLPLLEHVNGIRNPLSLRAGQVLIIPDAPPARPAGRPAHPPHAATPAPHHAAPPARAHPPAPHPRAERARRPHPPEHAARTASYVVRPGDTLYHLAATHGTTVQALEAMNGLRSSTIMAGQVLRLPDPWTPPSPRDAPASPASRPDARRPAPPAGPGAGGAAEHHPEHHIAAEPPSPRPEATRPTPPPPVVAEPWPAEPWPGSMATAEAAPREEPASPSASPESRVVEPAPAPAPGAGPAVPSRVRISPAPSAYTAAATHMALLSHIRQSALGYLGIPYRWGGTTTAGLDCSGLVQLVYSPYLANVPRTSYEQWTLGVPVHKADLEVGDLVFFNTDGSGASHVGIYIGNGEFVHPAFSARRVVIERLDSQYYMAHYIGARRVL
jgi:peptidoglycan DL-endopeptidase LytE